MVPLWRHCPRTLGGMAFERFADRRLHDGSRCLLLVLTDAGPADGWKKNAPANNMPTKRINLNGQTHTYCCLVGLCERKEKNKTIEYSPSVKGLPVLSWSILILR